MSIEGQPELESAIEYLVNGVGAALFEFLKWGAQYGYENPEVPYKVLILLLIFSILAPLTFVCIKILVLFFILIKDLIVSRREKAELKRPGKEKVRLLTDREIDPISQQAAFLHRPPLTGHEAPHLFHTYGKGWSIGY